MTEIVGVIHDLGVPVLLHSDGNLNEILDRIHSTGIDGYQSVDPQGHMDIRAVRETYPDRILMGNVNCSMLQNADEVQIRESVRYYMEFGGKGMRCVFRPPTEFSAACPIKATVSCSTSTRGCAV